MISFEGSLTTFAVGVVGSFGNSFAAELELVFCAVLGGGAAVLLTASGFEGKT